MIRLLKKAVFVSVVSLAAFISLIYFFIGTTLGLVVIAKMVSLFSGASIELIEPSGNLMHQVQIKQLRYKNQQLKITINNLNLHLSLNNNLFRPVLFLDTFNINTLMIQHHKSIYKATNLQLKGRMSSKKINLSLVKMNIFEHTLDAHFQSEIQFPYVMSGELSVNPNTHLKKEQILQGKLTFQGDAHALRYKGKFDGLIDLLFQGTLTDFHQLNAQLKWEQFLWLSLNKDVISKKGQLKLFGTLAKLQLELETQLESKQVNAWTLNLDASGQVNLSEQTLAGKLNIKNTSLDFPALGLHLKPINLAIATRNSQWQVKGVAIFNEEKINLQGTGNYSPRLQGKLAFDGNNLLILNTKEYQIKISPQLKVEFSPSGLSLSGSITIPYAIIKPEELTESIVLPEDVEIKTKKIPEKNWLDNMMIDVVVNLKDNILLDYAGLNTNLVGELRLQQTTQRPLFAFGNISLKKGRYKAYGQDLTIEQGHLTYTGSLINNPSINLRAGKYVKVAANQFSSLKQKVRVGVEVTGQLTEPNIRLFSIPSTFSQSDILSLIVIGKPASEAAQGADQLLLAALTSATSDKAEGFKILKQLKQTTGVNLNFKTDNGKQKILVGKALAKRIYVNYAIGLSQADPNVLTFKYYLTKFLSLQLSNSETNSGVDILYESEIAK